MYYLKEMIGEEAVNRALRKVLQQYAYAQPPYPTSYALVDAFRAETPPQYQYLIQDLFYDITLFSNRTFSATAKKRADGKYDVTIHVDAKEIQGGRKGRRTRSAGERLDRNWRIRQARQGKEIRRDALPRSRFDEERRGDLQVYGGKRRPTRRESTPFCF